MLKEKHLTQLHCAHIVHLARLSNRQANMALFEADGKRWVADAVGNVAAYLKEQLADQKHITVLA